MTDPATVVVKTIPLISQGTNFVWRRIRPDTSSAALDAHADNLAQAVRRQEIPHLEHLRVVPGGQFDVTFARHSFVGSAGGAEIGDLDEVAEYYSELDTGRLVILGEPGAGKTVLALTLLLALLKGRRQNHPVPVRFNANTWDGAASLDAWIEQNLVESYHVNRRVARALIDTGRILPVVDGLDEMQSPIEEPRLAPAMLQRFNAPPWLGRGVVLTCRQGYYESIVSRGGHPYLGIRRGTPVTVWPLTGRDIIDALETTLAEEGIERSTWAVVRDSIAGDSAGLLATKLNTPLFLSLAAAHLRNGDERKAARLAQCKAEDELEDLLFAGLLPAALESERHRRHAVNYESSKVAQWLAAMARDLPKANRGNQVAVGDLYMWAGPRRVLMLKALFLMATVFATSVVCLGSAVALDKTSLLAVIGFAAIFSAFGTVPRPPYAMMYKLSFSRGTVLLALAGGLGGYLGAFATSVAWHFAFGGGYGVSRHLAAACIITAIIFAFLKDGSRALPVDPARLLRYDARSACLLAAALGAPFILVEEIYYGWGVDTFVIGASVPLAFFAALASASWQHLATALVFRLRGNFAPRPLRFLNWCHSAGLLRVTGSAYQFRHESYQLWLLELAPPAAEP